ncbi:MAG: hypothetical protein DWQ37_12210 [Planctomycetota bacterium]|nr:MAG: hypothetical protein DWQ37_12210 [Planctomycetota bacterium]
MGAGFLGTAVGILGGICVPRGQCRRLVLSLLGFGTVLGIAFLLVCAVAVVAGQPYHVWYALAIPGLVLTFVFGGLLPVINAQYRQAEMRRLEAEELRRS